MPQTKRIEATTTAALVTLSNAVFADQDTIEIDMQITFNGFADNYTGTVRFARNATAATKNAAVRTEVNAVLAGIEGVAPLTNANIQIVGLPV